MGAIKIAETRTTRRGFVKEVTIGSAGAAVAGALRAALDPGLIAAPQSAVQAPAAGELKYRKYFTTELTREEYEIGYGAMKNMFMVFCDGDIIEGCHFFSAISTLSASR